MAERIPVNDNSPIGIRDIDAEVPGAHELMAKYRQFVGSAISNAQESAPAQVQALKDVYHPVALGFPHAIDAARIARSALEQYPQEPAVQRAAAEALRNLRNFAGRARRHMGEE